MTETQRQRKRQRETPTLPTRALERGNTRTSVAYGRGPRISFTSCWEMVSFTSNRSASSFKPSLCVDSKSRVRLYADSTSARTSESIRSAVVSEYGLSNCISSFFGKDTRPT